MSGYRYEHFTFGTLVPDLFPTGSPAPGESFPDFDLPSTDGGRVNKADFVGRRLWPASR